jgi:TrmH family RNA methyltransferase
MEKVVIVEPEIPENTGFIARLAANFDAELRVVNPEFNLSESRKTASGCQDKLRDTKIFDTLEDAIEDLEYVVGTKPGRGTGIEGFRAPENTSLVIGRESSGLSNSELELCDAVVHIETGEYSSLNQSHAAAILMHKMFIGQEESTEIDGLETVKEETDEVTLKLLKRAAPTETEARAAISEIKNAH